MEAKTRLINKVLKEIKVLEELQVFKATKTNQAKQEVTAQTINRIS